MVRVAFAARLGHAATKPAGPWSLVVTNPFTGHPLSLDPEAVLNQVDGVAAVLIDTTYSGRREKIKPGYRHLVNPHTGNTFLVHTSAILKENP